MEGSEGTVVKRDGILTRFFIKFPTLSGIHRGTGLIAYQTDETLVLLGGEMDREDEPVVENEKSESILPAYLNRVIEIIKGYREYDFNDFVFEITSKENVSINEYEMCKYTGKHTFTYKEEPYEMDFVAYTTRLKGNNAAIYWMVIDESVDQSLGELIESHADKMAQTLHE